MCDCESKINCNCGSTLTGDIKFDGSDFECIINDIVQFSIITGAPLNDILTIVFTQLCSIETGIENGELTGASWYDGVGNPSDLLGADGDYYLNLIPVGAGRGDVWAKAGGTWGVLPVGNILGPEGDKGPQGDVGLSFRFGVGVPTVGLGNDGDTYVDLASPLLDVYTKSLGVWTDTTLNLKGDPGTNGLDGNDGTNGTDGTNFLQGTGVPLIGLGDNGDSYLDSLTGDLYLKTAGVWNLTGNFYGGGVAVAYGFRALKTLNQVMTIGAVVGDISLPVNFEDDTTPPNFDHGNDMYQDAYVVPIGGIKQKFIIENINWSATNHTVGANVEFSLIIYADGVAIAGALNLQTLVCLTGGTSALIPSIVTDYVTLNAGQVVSAWIKKTVGAIGGTQPVITFDANCVMSNSFEV